MVAMQNILPVLCFAAGLALAWWLPRRRAQEAREAETAFKALSADALARNNQAFLELARAALAQTQEAARGDLEKRQQAIGELVAPVRASLEGMAGKIQGLEKARRRVCHAQRAGAEPHRNANATALGDGEAGDGAADTERARALG